MKSNSTKKVYIKMKNAIDEYHTLTVAVPLSEIPIGTNQLLTVYLQFKFKLAVAPETTILMPLSPI
jgi:hypothetical protein